MNSSNNKWINNGGIYYQIPADFKTYSSPGKGVFKIYYNRERGFGLERMCDSFDLPTKIYDLGIDSFLRKVEDTWKSRYFKKSEKNLGVILSGVKGAGKTLSAKVLCNKLNLPVIIVSNPIDGLTEFIQSIDFECTIFIDEAEKMFNDQESTENSQMLLRMIDGSMNLSRKLYVLTTNSLKVNENLIGRPGRIRYIKKFTNITPEAVDEFLKDNLIDKSKADDIKNLVSLLEVSTIDTLNAIVDEVNIHGNLSNYEELNLTLKSNLFTYLSYSLSNSNVCSDRLIEDLRAFVKNQFILGKKLMGISLASWLYSEFDMSLDPGFSLSQPNKYLISSNRPLSEDDCDREIDDGPYTKRRSNITVGDYIRSNFMTYDDSCLIKLNNLTIGDEFGGHGHITKILSDGWMIVTGRGQEYLIYAEKEGGRRYDI